MRTGENDKVSSFGFVPEQAAAEDENDEAPEAKA
jgi:hypothetical protein